MAFKYWKRWRKDRKERDKSPRPLLPSGATDVPDHPTTASGPSQSSPQPERPNPPRVTLNAQTTPTISSGPHAPPTTVQIPNAPDASITSAAIDDGNLMSSAATLSSDSSPELLHPPAANPLPDLWNQAYDELEARESKVVQAYERLLSVQLNNENALVDEETENLVGGSAEDRVPQMKKLLDRGLQKTESSTAIYTKIKDGIDKVIPFKELITTATKASPEAAIVWVGVTFTIEILRNPFTEPGLNRAGITHVVSRIKWYCDLASLLLDPENIPQAQRPLQRLLESRILELYRELLLYQMKSICRYFKSKFANFWKDAIMLDNWQGQVDTIKAVEAALVQDIQTYDNQSIVAHLQQLSSTAQSQHMELEAVVSCIQEEIRKKAELTRLDAERDCLRDLRLTNPSHDRQRIVDAKGGLLRDSYTWVLESSEFNRWQKDVQSRRLWITGDPGKGKTMLMCGIIEELEKNPFKRLCYFFCQATLEKLNSAQGVLRGLIFHLAVTYPWLLSYVVAEHRNQGRALFEDHNAWQAMSDILRAMLSDPDLNEVLLLVDGLDECVTDQDKLLRLIDQLSDNPKVKLIIASRGLPALKKGLGDKTAQSTTLSLEINGDRVAAAVRVYIERKVWDLAQNSPFKGNPEIQKEVQNHLIANSQDTFLWVALVCKALGGLQIFTIDHVRKALQKSPSGLDELYKRMIDGVSESMDAKLCKDILAVTSVLQRPLSMKELFPILESGHDPESLEQAIGSCGCFLHLQNDFVYFVHQSAQDFLHNQELESFEIIFPRGLKDMQQTVSSRLLDVISKVLNRNIYNLEGPGVLKKDIVRPQTDPLASSGYCCLHWAHHVMKTDLAATMKDHGLVHKFLLNSFLHWIEAMALLNSMGEAIQAVQTLQRAHSAEQGLSTFIHDANRFLLYHRRVIEDAPLQLYASALLFSPEQSLVRNHFWHEAPEWMTMIADTGKTWGMNLQTMEGHKDLIWSLGYSPDGRWLVSGSRDGTLKLWDANSGSCVHMLGDHGKVENVEGISGGHFRPPHTRPAGALLVAFSPDSRSFFSVTENALVKLWDTETRNLLCEFEIKPGKIKATDVSTDGHSMAFYFPDGTIGLWNIETATPFCKVKNDFCEVDFDCKTDPALALCGQWLAAKPRASYSRPRGDCDASTDDTINIWNTSTGKLAQVVSIGGVSLDTVIRWSTDGQWLAAGVGEFPTVRDPGDGKIKIWQRGTGRVILELKAELPLEYTGSRLVTSMAFSAQSELLAASIGHHICIWNTMTPSSTACPTWSFMAHGDNASGEVHSLYFSSDSQCLVTAGPYTGKIKVWDLSWGADDASHAPATLVHFSDEYHFATYHSSIEEIRFWDLTTRRDALPVKFHQSDVAIITLSQDNQHLASANSAGEIAIWNTKSGNAPRKFRCFTDCKLETGILEKEDTSLAFLNSLQLAANFQGKINILSTSDGTIEQTLPDSDQFLVRITVSQDGRWLAYVSRGEGARQDVVKFWDLATSQCSSTASMAKHQSHITSLSFSSNCQQLAVTSSGLVLLWDLISGTCIRALKYMYTGDVLSTFDSRIETRLHTQFGFLNLGRPEFDPLGIASECKMDLQELESAKLGFESSLRLGHRIDGWEGIPPLERYGFDYGRFDGYGFEYVAGVWKELGWILLNGKRLLRIPVDYTPTLDTNRRITPVINGSILMWASRTGKLVRVHFAAQHDNLSSLDGIGIA
ncbi:nacht and wd domain protein [Colletotrichum asianum]|uniref:Nacht and wd domain protein n=1 Tax=Colletotrichum asianum TaxID=702518 RepID=A0A8H3W8S5_9PEZI|nr:nacht and wd domain protein [Colletotrichum asianum]